MSCMNLNSSRSTCMWTVLGLFIAFSHAVETLTKLCGCSLPVEGSSRLEIYLSYLQSEKKNKNGEGEQKSQCSSIQLQTWPSVFTIILKCYYIIIIYLELKLIQFGQTRHRTIRFNCRLCINVLLYMLLKRTSREKSDQHLVRGWKFKSSRKLFYFHF